MSTSAINVVTIREMFTFINRRQLSRISETNRRFNAIIVRYFRTAPYLVLPYLKCTGDVKWKWSPNESIFNLKRDERSAKASDLSAVQISQLANSKFLRFKRTSLNFDRIPIRMLTAIKHLWNNGRLFIKSGKYLRSTSFANIVNNCHDLQLNIPGSTRMLQQLLRGNSKAIKLIDKNNNPARQLPLDDILDFLFQPDISEAKIIRMSAKGFQYWVKPSLIVNMRFPLKREIYGKVIDGIKEKFLAIQDQTNFGICIYHGDRLSTTQVLNYCLEHPNDNKKLNYRVYKTDCFSLFSHPKRY
ncbi:hypothetical protein DdX_12020 [Ditylenchus destructor]|uniref:Uncharacterized protein n=1 Tax=Ditylenchus destructor TaxID=166010 RepID=A0AAD4N1E1_9BILA|nr:hypothetical protein DdX_12020 [Ditylenchus destructor]